MSAAASLVVCVLSIIATSWGRAGLSNPGGVAPERVYRIAWKLGPPLAILAGVMAAALHLGGAP